MDSPDWAIFQDKLRRYVSKRVNAQIVDDVVATILLRLVQSQDRLSQARLPIAWVYRVATNVITDHYRNQASDNRKLEAYGQDPTGTTSNHEDNALQELIPCLEPFIKNLPPPYDQALLLTDVQGMSQKQAAENLGISLSGMKSRIQRAREKLKSKLLACCKIELGHKGGVIDVEPKGVRSQRCCNSSKAI